MGAGAMPFMAMSLDAKEWARIAKKGPDWSLVKTSPQGKDLCEKMLTFSDSQRPSMKQCLQHEWFSCHGHTLQRVVAPAQLSALHKFTEMTALSQSMLLEIAGRLPMERAEKIVGVFEAFDANKDGAISKQELQQGFTRLGMKDQGLLENTFKALDVDGNGSLSFSEFAAGILLMFKDLLEGRFRALFKRHDKNSDGMMSRDEVRAFLSVARTLSKKDTQGNHQDVIDKLFPGNSSKVSYEDLRRLVLPGF